MQRPNYTYDDEAAGQPTSLKSLILQSAAVLGACILVALMVLSGKPWTGCLPALVVVGPTDAGTTVTLQVGDTLDVSLPGNPTNGMTWCITAVDPTVLQANGDPVFLPSMDGFDREGLITCQLTAGDLGETDVTLTGTPGPNAPAGHAVTYAVHVVVDGRFGPAGN